MSIPDAQTMEQLLPPDLPSNWENLKVQAGPGSVLAVYAHRSPLPESTSNPDHGLQFIHPGYGWQYPYEAELPDLDRSVYDCIGAVWILYTKDEDLRFLDPETTEGAKDAAHAEAEAKLAEILESPETAAALASGEITQEELEKLVSDMRGILGAATQLRDMFEAGRFLDRRADYLVSDGERHITRVVIGRYVITGALLSVYQYLPDGDTPMHALGCLRVRVAHQRSDTSDAGLPNPALTESPGFKPPGNARFVGLSPKSGARPYYSGDPLPPCECSRCTYHRAADCSTRAGEGFVHKEQLRSLLEDIFARVETLS